VTSHHQQLHLSGVGAHHQNGVAEVSIRVVTKKARAMMQHAFLHWPDKFLIALWPFALDYACWLHNHTPHKVSGFAPIEIFASTSIGCENLRRARVWGSPGYVLSPKLQDGKKLPKWAPKSRRGQFLGFSPSHSSTVALMRNLTTHHVNPQYHIVFDELFSTVHSVNEHTLTWLDLFTYHHEFYGPFEDEEDDTIHFPELSDEWVPPSKAPLVAPPADAVLETIDPIHDRLTSTPTIKAPVASSEDIPPSTSSGRPKRNTKASDFLGDWTTNATIPPSATGPLHFITSEGHSVRFAPTPISRSILGCLSTFCHDDLFIHNLDWDLPFRGSYTAYNALSSLLTDPISHEVEWLHPFSLAAKTTSEDTPTLRNIHRMSPAEQCDWFDSMDKEFIALQNKDTFTIIDRSAVPTGHQIVKSAWAFRRKRRPNGLIYKLKSRFVLRGDLQKLAEAEETYSPVVDWSTVRLLFVLTAAQGLKTQTIDFNAAFVQADLPAEPLYLELPPGYGIPGKDKVYKVTKSLYGDVRAAKLWYKKHLSSALVDKLGMTKSCIDTCLYFRDDLIFVHYVDGGIIACKDEDKIQQFMIELQSHGFDLGIEEDYAGYLGVDIKKRLDGSIHMTQTGLIDCILDDLGLTNSKTFKHTPAANILGPHKESAPLRGEFNYRSVLGKMMYLSTNTRPDIAFANHQCARWSIDPREPHGVAIKHIARYLLKTRTMGMIIQPTEDLTWTALLTLTLLECSNAPILTIRNQ
jgi:hypothetical protein